MCGIERKSRDSRAPRVAPAVKNLSATQEARVQSLGGKVPWRTDRLATPVFLDFFGGSDNKESSCNVEDLGLIPGLRRSPGAGHGNPFQYSYLENPHGQRSLGSYSSWGHKESDTPETFTFYKLCLVTQYRPTLCVHMDCSSSGSSVHGDSPGKKTGMGCHTLLQGIFPTQGSNPGLLHCRQILYWLSHQEGMKKREFGNTIKTLTNLGLSGSPD